MTRKIAITLSKGGVGKTTTAVNLAAGLAQQGKRVLLIDTDTQNQIPGALGVETSADLADYVLNDNRQAFVQARDNLYVLAGGASINSIVQAVRQTDFMPHDFLNTKLAPLSDYFDYILVDTAPSWGEMAINVLAYADEVMCPVPLEMLAVRGLRSFLERAKPIIDRTNGVLRYVVPTMLDRRYSQTAEILDVLEQQFGSLLTAPIRTDARLSESPAHGLHIFEYAPRSKGAEDYLALTKWMIKDE